MNFSISFIAMTGGLMLYARLTAGWALAISSVIAMVLLLRAILLFMGVV